MNRYKSHLEVQKFKEQVKCFEDVPHYIYESTKEQRFYITTKLAGMFEFILKQKEYQENLKSDPKYSDEDIEFLKELNILDLTHNEAFLTKRLNEHYKAMEYLSYRLSYSSPKVIKAVQDEANRLDKNCTPRILIMTARNANKK